MLRSEEMRHAGPTDSEIPSAHVYRGGVSASVDYEQFYFFLCWWPLVFSEEWWDLFWHEVLCSLAVCC
jgi:hypothetical protein